MKRKKATSQLIHEVYRNEHRIIQTNSDGTTSTGDWFTITEVAHLNSKYFVVVGESVLPQGIFTISEKQHLVIST